jgi:alpha-beta hydrolase superfamily lysophospholipase
MARYDDFARFLVSHGFAVYGNDHLGHGKTARTPDDRGFFADREGYLRVMDDLHTLVGRARADFPGLPVLLLGHSMGSFVARVFCMRHSEEIHGAIFMGTGGANPLSSLGYFVLAMESLLHGERYRSGLFHALSLGAYSAAIKDRKTNLDWLSTDGDAVRKYRDDELCGFRFTVSASRDLLRMLDECTRPGWAASVRSDLPVLVISGGDDPVGAAGKGVRETFRDLQDAGVKDAELILYENMRHEILNEQDKKRVYSDILDWCKRKGREHP